MQTSSKRQSSDGSSSSSSSFLTRYFLIILLVFACMLLALNSRFTEDATSMLELHLQSSTARLTSTWMNTFAAGPSLDSTSTTSYSSATTTRLDTASHQVQDTANINNNNNNNNNNQHDHRLAGLNCEPFGGPSNELAQEMVYWEDIPSDAKFVSPFYNSETTQYMTFEPDQGGWNNIRMAMESLLATAFAMGRTLVLPPHQRMYLLGKKDNQQRDTFSFEHFFHMERISQEHDGFNIISMDEYLKLFLDGQVTTKRGAYLFPPNNRTDWNGAAGGELQVLKDWLRESSKLLEWDPEQCMAAFPRSPNASQELEDIHAEIQQEGYPSYEQYVGKPHPVDASPKDRMKENWAERKGLCIYTEKLQQARWVHFPVSHAGKYKSRMLVHFYAFLFFADWKTDLWTKRFVRDHVRYIDEIQCAAARIVAALRNRSSNSDNEFDTLHVRRGDFQYKPTRVPIERIYNMTKLKIEDNTTIYIATDEKDKNFFNLLKEHYDVVFLDDFKHELEGVNTNYYGMIDQLVASRGRIFFGCWFSTFTGYINRLRGYHADDHQTPGYEMGIVPSYYYALLDRYLHMQEFYPVKKQFYAREFPTSWRLIDTGVEAEEREEAVVR